MCINAMLLAIKKPFAGTSPWPRTLALAATSKPKAASRPAAPTISIIVARRATAPIAAAVTRGKGIPGQAKIPIQLGGPASLGRMRAPS